MKVKYKVIFGFTIVLTLLSVLSIISYTGLRLIKSNMELITNRSNPMVLTLNDIISSTLVANRNIVSTSSADDAVLETIDSNLIDIFATTDSNVRYLTELFLNDDENFKILKKAKFSYDALKDNSEKIIIASKRLLILNLSSELFLISQPFDSRYFHRFNSI